LAYLGENGLLRLSVRVFGVHIEFGLFKEGADGEWFRVAQERCRFTGLQDLMERDVFRLFREGQVEVGSFHAPNKEYRDLLERQKQSAFVRSICWFAVKSVIVSSRSTRLSAKAQARHRCSRRMIIASCARPDSYSISGRCRRAW